MPCFANLTKIPASELSAARADVWINSILYPYASVLRLQKTKGLTPGEATIQFSVEKTAHSPVTLNRYEVTTSGGVEVTDLPRFGSRVILLVNGTPIFSGFIMRRQDSGNNDTIIYTATDDRDLLAGVPVRGALVWDGYEEKVKFCPSFSPRTNPQGAWNCTIAPVTIKQRRYATDSNDNGVYKDDIEVWAPVFLPYAKHVMVYDAPNQNYTGEATKGSFNCWTPRRWLQYLCVLANLAPSMDEDGEPAIQGINSDTWRSIATCNYLQWDFDKINSLRGVDPAITQDFDPLDAKMPDLNFQGQALLAAISDTLAVSGTHEFTLGFMSGRGTNIWRDVVGELSFYPVGWSGFKTVDQAKEIPLQRYGTLENADSCIDFDILMDASQVRDCVVVEGDPVRLECRLECNVNDDGTVDEATSSIVPAWTLDSILVQSGGNGRSQQTGFFQVIHGNPLTDAYKNNPGNYAKYPPDITKGDVPNFTSWLTADGSGGRPLAYAHMPEAVTLARQMFPTVFRAFQIKTSYFDGASVLTTPLLAYLQGVNNQFADTSKYPILNWRRTVAPQQLQYQINDFGNDSQNQANWLLSHFPIRVEVKNRSENKWHDVGQVVGFYMTGDGLLWCETLGERIFPSYDSIINPRPSYSGGGGDGWKNPGQYSLLSFRLNIAMPMDHRVYGYANNPRQSILEDRYKTTLGGPRMLYVDSPEAYKEHHQVHSYPSAIAGNTALNRILASGNERQHAYYAAQRRLAQSTRVTTNSIWRFAGIRTSWQVGDWVEQVRCYSPDGTWVERPFPIRAPIGYITYDFQNQKTEVGGLYSNLGGL